MKRWNLLCIINKLGGRASSKISVLWRQPHNFITKLFILPFSRLNFAIRFRVLLSIMNYFNARLHTINLGGKKVKSYGLCYIVRLITTWNIYVKHGKLLRISNKFKGSWFFYRIQAWQNVFFHCHKAKRKICALETQRIKNIQSSRV